MLRASSSSLIYGRVAANHRHYRQLQQLGDNANSVTKFDGSTQQRYLSFKAFANRKTDGKSSNSSSNGSSNNDKQRVRHQPHPQQKREDPSGANNAGRIANNNRNSNNRPPPASWRSSRNENASPGEAATFPSYNAANNAPPRRNSGPPSSYTPPPWKQRYPQQQGASFGERGNPQSNIQNRGNPQTNAQNMDNANNRQQQQQQQPPSRPVDNDLRDISHLRNTFMKNPNNKPREPWRSGSNSRGGNYDNDRTSSLPPPPTYSRPSFRGGNTHDRSSTLPPPPTYSRPSFSPSSFSDNTPKVDPNVDLTSAAAGVGAKWTPSHYKPKTPPPQQSIAPPSGIPGIPTIGGMGFGNNNEVRSIEEVMKANALQRKQNMENRYHNAGERVPYNVDEFGNPVRSPNQFGWRNTSRQTNGGGRGAGNSQHRGWGNQRGRPGGGRGGGRGGGYNQQSQRPRQPFGGNKRKQIRRHLPASMPTSVRLPATPLTMRDLSLLLRVRKRTIVRTLRALGEQIAYKSATQDSYTIDVEMMEFICVELGIEALKVDKKESALEEAERRAMRQGTEELDEEAKTEEEERYALLPPRSPVVSIMGHVDHGKTTLMDALRRRAVTNTPKAAGKAAGGKKGKKKKGDKSRGKGGVSAEDDNVAGTEAGGITQVITAFEVPLPLEDGGADENGDISTVTFLDTPGHAAFKKMRQSGSSATDVIVLVVAADDGISPQTIEIIEMFKSIARSQPQSISLVVAVSKIDKPGIDVDEAIMRIENQLMEHEILTENVLAGGGDEGEFGACQLFPVSGVTGEGLDDLVEGLALQSEIMDLRADEDAKGQGIVIDARMEKGLGVVADCVIRWGNVSKGDFVVSGTNGGRVKFLNDVSNKPLKKARPSQPVRIVGFKTLPKAGDPIVCAGSEEEAKELIRLRESEIFNEERAAFEQKELELQVMGTPAKNNMMMQKKREHFGFNDNGEGGEGEEGIKKESIRIPVVIKADSHGALDAVRDALVAIGIESKLDIVIDPVGMSTGVITTSDVVMARESGSAIFVFGKVGIADKETKTLADDAAVPIRNHDIIYRLLDDAKDFFGKYLPVEYVEKVHGKANVQAVFDVTDKKTKKSVSVAGLRVSEGHLFKKKSIPSMGSEKGAESMPCFFRVSRKGEIITAEYMDTSPSGKKLTASSLRKVKEDVDSVRRGDECGLGLMGFNDLQEGDVVECYSIEERRPAI